MNNPASQQATFAKPQLSRMKLAGNFAGEAVEIAYARWQPENNSAENNLKGTVFCLHGLTRQKRDFDYIAESLVAAGYDVIAADVPGRGESSRFENPQNYGVEVYAPVFSAFLKQMNLPKVHWIGTSMGGLIALMLGIMGEVDIFKSLTLVDISPKPSRAGLDRITAYITENLPVFSDPAQYEVALKMNLPLGDVDDSVWHHYAVHQLRQQGPARYAFHFDATLARRALADLKADVDLSAGLAAIPCPIALVAGGISDLCTAVEIGDLKAAKPDALIHVCPGAGHVPALSDAPTKDFIRNFIDAANA